MSKNNLLKNNPWEVVSFSLIIAAFIAGGYAGYLLEKESKPIHGNWSCSILNRNSFGECLGNLAQELDVVAAPAAIDTNMNDACQYAQSRSTNTLWVGNADNSTPWADALERAEYQAQIASEGSYAEVSPARKVLESIGVSYHSKVYFFIFFGVGNTLVADLSELEKNDEARKALSDYISNLEMDSSVSSFYIESPSDSGILQAVNIADRTNITLGSEGFKENLIEAHNLIPVQCPTSD